MASQGDVRSARDDKRVANTVLINTWNGGYVVYDRMPALCL